MIEKACRKCHMISVESICPNCKSTSLSDDWTGIFILIDAENSGIAEKMGANKPGKYAVRVR